ETRTMSDLPKRPTTTPTELSESTHIPSDAPDPALASRIPEQLGGYRVLHKLGEGGMGAVYVAEDTLLKRRIALKVMRPEIAARPTARERFLREARAAAALEHDHIVTIHQV